MYTDGCRGHDAGIRVDEMCANKESTKAILFQAEEGIIDSKGKEDNERSISYWHVEHVDMGVCPGVPLGNEGIQSSSIDKETHKKQKAIREKLKVVHFASRIVDDVGDIGDIGDIGNVAHAYLCEGHVSLWKIITMLA